MGWRIRDELVYLVEGASNDTANIINWGQSVGLFTDPVESAPLAEAIPDSDGVCFIPAFSGLQAPVNDYQVRPQPGPGPDHAKQNLKEKVAL